MEKLLIIDDERYFARQYSRELEKFYKVTLVCSAEEGLTLLRSDLEIHALIIDIQMPTPAKVAEHETKNGVDTGIWLLCTIRNELVERRLPILILTNRREDDIQTRVQPLRFSYGQVEINYKPHVSPREFAKRVTSMLERFKKT
jgi:CheY-like chemotaxis protein